MGSASQKGNHRPFAQPFRNSKGWRGGSGNQVVNQGKHVWKRAVNLGRGANSQVLGHHPSGTSDGFQQKQTFGKGFSKSWDAFPSHRSEGQNLSSYSLPVEGGDHHVTETATFTEPFCGQGRSSSLVLGARVIANTIEVPASVPLPNLLQASEEIFPSVGQRKKGEVEGKRRKINKEKLKAVLAVIDCMDEEEMEEVNFDPSSTQHISPNNPGIFSEVNQPLLDVVAREMASSSDSDSEFLDSPASVDSHDSFCGDDINEMNHCIFSWDSYDNFAQFCGKIGINLSDMEEAERFLNTIRSQHSLPPINLEARGNLIELFEALSL